ncbi:2239_t:CDS:1 [Acaulospora colombiana]|uniref:2239_t:CDS:1 n=1 Tax=Acaulospora colombiana TaxID=27376 RepID=A0ACA9K1H2_9GLOM|nr:2239_t:CDS:1 [Acaulospora colombiana]
MLSLKVTISHYNINIFRGQPIFRVVPLEIRNRLFSSGNNKQDDGSRIPDLKGSSDEKKSGFKDTKDDEIARPTKKQTFGQNTPSAKKGSAAEEYDQFFLKFSSETTSEGPGTKEEKEDDSLLMALKTPKEKTKQSTHKTSNADVAKLLSDFLLPSDELHRIHIHASYNNTIVTLTNSKKDVLITTSGGIVGFKKAQRGGYEAAHQAAVGLIEKIKSKKINVRNVEILVNGFGPGRDAAFKAIASSENPWNVKRITDTTPLPFNGCRPKKVRRL